MMKKMLLLAAVPLAIASGCATTAPTGNGGAIASAGTYYCWKDRLETAGDRIGCNWEVSPARACRSGELAYLDKRSLTAGPSEARRRCDNGQWLVQATTK